MGRSVYAQKARFVLVGQRGRLSWNSMKAEIHFEDPAPIVNQVYLGCTRRVAKVNPQAVQTKNELFQKLTTEAMDAQDLTKDHCSSKEITSWSFDLQGHAGKCVERCCEIASEAASSLQQALMITCYLLRTLNRKENSQMCVRKF